MPPRSKVTTMLPAYIRQELERRLFENGFRDYEGLANWVRGQGYAISDDSLWRYGRALQQQLAATELTVCQICGLAKPGAGHEPLTAQALITVAQQKALATLVEMDEVKPSDLNAVANLTRAAIAQQRWGAELKARNEHRHESPAKPKDGLDEPPHTFPNERRRNAPPQQPRATDLAVTVHAEPQDGSPAAGNPGDDSHPPTAHRLREMSTPAIVGSPAVPDNEPIEAILPARLRGTPRIVEAVIPFAIADAPSNAFDTCAVHLFAAQKCFIALGSRKHARISHSDPVWSPKIPDSRMKKLGECAGPSIRHLRAVARRTHGDAARRKCTQIDGHAQRFNLDAHRARISFSRVRKNLFLYEKSFGTLR